jgi:hypothetical protein
LTLALDMRARNITVQLGVIADELRTLDLPADRTDMIFSLLSIVQDSAAALRHDLGCPGNPTGDAESAAPVRRQPLPQPVSERGSNVVRLFPFERSAPA